MRRRLLIVVIATLAALAALFSLGPRVVVDTRVVAPALPEDLDAWLEVSEAAIPDVRPGTEKRIVWADPATRQATPLSVIYLHGFSATRQEIAPVCDRVARQLQANLFYTRLRGHGRSGDAMAEATVNAWLADAVEALEIGRRLGQRVVVIGTSTGGTLATWLAARSEGLASLVLISPNFGVANPTAGILLWPWGEQLARLIVGPRRSWEPHNPSQALYWSHDYPTQALLPMMGLVDLVEGLDLKQITLPTLVLYSPEDSVVSPARTEARFQELGTARKALIEVEETGDPSHHVIAGDIMSPGSTDAVVKRIVGFVRGNL